MNKIKISAVSYLNTIPLLYGIENNLSLNQQIILQKDIPAVCAQKLLSGEVDLGLVPVAIIPQLKESHIVSDYCIGAHGKVKSVLIVSDKPLEQITSIYLDYQSRTSVALCKILCREFWKINPSFLNTEKGYEENIGHDKAGVIIGDRTFKLEKEYNYVYDLAEEWEKFTGRPFVFAAWVSNKKLSDSFIKLFNIALKYGIENIDQAIQQNNNQQISDSELKKYLTQNIDFMLNEDKKLALQLFLNKLDKLQ